MALAFEDQTNATQTSDIQGNPFLSGVAFKNGANFSIWSTTSLTYDLNVGAKPPGERTGDWSNGLSQAIHKAIADVSHVCGVSFTEVNGSADIEFWSYKANDGNLGYSYAITDASYRGVFVNSRTAVDPKLAFTYGSYDYITVIHEFLHNMGLAHPHDSYAKFPGVTNSSSLGKYNLNQNVYTVMSYNDAGGAHGLKTASGTETTGWTPHKYGYGVLGAFDIAMLQELYGANMSYHAGNNTYYLPTSDKKGTYYKSIWDAGGTDTFEFDGNKNVTIDLRAATLNLSDHELAGGALSTAKGVHGGFTIANGVVIENAVGGSGNDRLIGNDAVNKISGRSGADKIFGGSGGDNLRGGNGDDVIRGGNGADVLFGQRGNDKLYGNGANDRFVFADDGSHDTVFAFTNDFDQLDLSAFNFSSKANALNHFSALTSTSVQFVLHGTEIVVKGIGMADLDDADIMI
ncbi:MAG: M10 family metallopeptidase C-terminal domain-containing protein [Hyphomicrobiaceae bacterium]|nr:M10 family metallopeptidase C-terminal domain-containing protein [Hyphomicrobiaceae bacterium]